MEKNNIEIGFSILESKPVCDYSACKSVQGQNRHTSLRIQRLSKIDYSTVFYEKKEHCDLLISQKQLHIPNSLEINFNVNKGDSKKKLKENIPIRKHHNSKIEIKTKPIHDKTYTQKKYKVLKNSQKNETQIKFKSQEFLQSDFCIKVAPGLSKCRECLFNSNKSEMNQQYSYCSFINYRKLFVSENGMILHSGFLEPSDLTQEDRQIWLPQPDNPPKSLTVEHAEKILFYIENLFYCIMEKEEKGINLHMGSVKQMTWKKIIQNTEESCNICTDLIFNVHWICPQCAFCICIDCYKAVKEAKEEENMACYFSLLCHNHEPHRLDTLLLTQIIPEKIVQTIHYTMKTVSKQGIISALPISETLGDKNYASIKACKRLMKNSFIGKRIINKTVNEKYALSFANAHDGKSSMCFENFLDNKYDMNSFFSELFSPTCGLKPSYESDNEDTVIQKDLSIAYIVNHYKNLNSKSKNKKTSALDFFHAGYPKIEKPNDFLLTNNIHTVAESSQFVLGVPHTWLNNGQLLLLHEVNLKLFQRQWQQSQAVIVSGINKNIVSDFWHPHSFCKVKEKAKSYIQNCKTGQIIHKLHVKEYWKGFECIQERARDGTKHCMPLKLTDWPTIESFNELLPQHFENVMKALPMHEYTTPKGVFNLAARLPTCYIQPELGLKIESGYGLAFDLDCATTNLHLNVVDTVNILVHASLPKDENHESYLEAMFQEVYDSGCDSITKQRYLYKEAPAGALWDIYNAADANKIQAFLFKIAAENESKSTDYSNLLQSNNLYLNKMLKKRLSDECGIKGCIIIQHVGDAIFIPAGTPYQVRNLRDCINVTKKFISPESIPISLKLVQESRNMKNLHPSLTQRLPINHIIYHSVKDALSCLLNKSNI